MANIKSAKKRIKVTHIRNLRNRSIRSNARTILKSFEALLEQSDAKAAQDMFPEVVSCLHGAASKGVYHKNTVSRKISRLQVRMNKLA